MAQLSVRLSTGEQYYIDLRPEDGDAETQLQNFLNEEPPFRQKWVKTTAGRHVRILSTDRDYYQQAAERLGANRAALSVARKLLQAFLPHAA